MMITENKNVLITGAAKRIGREIAVELAGAGWNVVVHYHQSYDQALELVSELQDAGVNAVALQAELSDKLKVEKLFNAAVDALGPITCLINNASVFEEDTAPNVSMGSWNGHMDVNLRAPFLLSQCLAKRLPDNSFASIVNIVDQRVWNPTSQFTSYTLSKMGLWDATQLLARSLAPRIRVNAVAPGVVSTDMTKTLPKEKFDALVSKSSIPRAGTPEEVANVLLYLVSDLSQYVTGQILRVDGGIGG